MTAMRVNTSILNSVQSNSNAEPHTQSFTPSFSIVILSWNRLDETHQCIERLRTLFPGEIVIVDQASTDGSLEYLQSRDDLTLVSLDKNLGVSGGRNVGFQAASGDILISLDSDAWFDESFSFDRLQRLFMENPDVAVVAFRVLNATTGDLDGWEHPVPESQAMQSFTSTRFKGGAHAIRKDDFLNVGLYDKSLFFFWEEMDLAFRLLAKNFTILYDPNFIVHHDSSPVERLHWNGGRFYYLVRNRLYLIRKYFSGWPRLSETVFLLAGYLTMALRNKLLPDYRRAVADAYTMPLLHTLKPEEASTLQTKWQTLEQSNRHLGHLVRSKILRQL